MQEIDMCKACGVPRMVSSELSWGGGGVISISYSPTARMVFYESGNIDQVFRGIEKLIGVPIEQMVIESKRRATRAYMEKVFSAEIEESARLFRETRDGGGSSISPERKKEILETQMGFDLQAKLVGRVYGYGDMWREGPGVDGASNPWRTQSICNPYSLLFYSADMVGTVEAFEQIDLEVEYQDLGDNTYGLKALPGVHPIELAQRLKRKRYPFKPGNVTHERCPECGIPAEVGRCTWDLEAGTITEPVNGRRMAFFNPQIMEAVFRDLEAELGDSIPEAIIEAQRLYGKQSMSADNWRRSGYDFKGWSALRGLGNITAFKADRKKLSLTLENSSMHLAMVGMAQALYELAWGTESSAHEWDSTDDGDLHITVRL